jgi:hypothetical protein
VPLFVYFDDRAQPRRERLLAVWRLRRDLECLPTGGEAGQAALVVTAACEIARELEELIAALDRRVPRVDQAGETEIARDAAALRAKAVERLTELAVKRPSRT